MLIIAPLIVILFGIVIETTMLRWLYKLDHLYGLLLTFAMTLIVEGLFRSVYSVSGQPYSVPRTLAGATDLGFMILPNYRAWVVTASVLLCMSTWFVIEKTKLGAYLARSKLDVPIGQIVTHHIRMQGITVGSSDDFQAMNKAISHHRIRPVVDKMFAFDELHTAPEYLQGAKHFGKIWIRF